MAPPSSVDFEQAEQAAIEYSKALDTEGIPTRIQRPSTRSFDRMAVIPRSVKVGRFGALLHHWWLGDGPGFLHWFRGIGVPVYEGYGLTEVAAAVTVDFDDPGNWYCWPTNWRHDRTH